MNSHRKARRMRMRAIISEGYRNSVSGTSRPLIVLLVFTLISGVLALTQVSTLKQQSQQAQQYRHAMAHIRTVQLEDAVAGNQCHSVSNTEGVTGAAAIREASDLVLAVLPSRSIPQYAATHDLVRLLPVTAHSDTQGVWLSETLAQDVYGDSYADLEELSDLQLKNDEILRVAGVFEWPEDGREQIFAYAIVSLEPPRSDKTYDQCWIGAWPDSNQGEQLALLTVNQSSESEQRAKIGQLNSTLGSDFDVLEKSGVLGQQNMFILTMVIFFVVGFVFVRIRRLELAATLHAGVKKVDLVWQLLVELSLWMIPANALVLATLWWQAQEANPDPPLAAFSVGGNTLLLANAATILGSVIAALVTREKHLFNYFKQR